ncbi:MAG TPA: hypothetical protein VJL29_03060 [Thermoguttaceae bacterium]|nr:hypothetical protein [Thermoguttaceae bacterium]
MKAVRQKVLTLGLAAVYLAAVALGHCFHNHGFHDRCCRHDGVGQSVADDHDTCACHGELEGRRPKTASPSHDDPAPVGFHGPSSRLVSVEHACPVCSFLSHHGLPGHVVAVATTGRVTERVAPVLRRVKIASCRAPQQPRAPPSFA